VEVYLYSIICCDGTLLNEAVAILTFTSEILYCFVIKQQLLTVISGQKSSGYCMDWQV